MNYEVQDVVEIIETLLGHVDPEDRDVVAEQLGVDEVLRILKGESDASEEEGTDSAMEADEEVSAQESDTPTVE